jgi:hypothetical protein
MAKSDKIGDVEISAPQLAAFLGVSRAWVNRLVDDGVIARTESRRFHFGETIRAYIAHFKDEDRRSTKVAAESRVRDARAREIELRIATREHKLVDTEEAIAAVDDVIGVLRTGCVGLPARITRDLQLRRKIEQEIDAILDRASDRLEERASALRASGEAAPAFEEVDA